jgi:hypothetical protein
VHSIRLTVHSESTAVRDLPLVQSLAVERLPYRTRALERIWRETCSSIRKRIPPFVISLIGLAVGSTYSRYLQKQIKETVVIAVISGFGANVLWFLGLLIYNTVRVPWLLDADAGKQISDLENRAILAETSVRNFQASADQTEAARTENRRLHELFGTLAEKGGDVLRELAGCSMDTQFAMWDIQFKQWKEAVEKEIKNLGFHADAVEFLRSGDRAEPMKGVVDARVTREYKGRVLEKHQDKLADFVSRRLP